MSRRSWPAASGVMHWPTTLAAKGCAPLQPGHLRHRAAADGGQLHCVVLDASGSMRRGAALARAKGVALDLLERAVRGGHQVALLALSGGRVLPLAPPQPARRALASRLAAVGGGGGTPLVQALDLAGRWLTRARRHSRGATPGTHLWLLTDGRSTQVPARPVGVDGCTVVDLVGGAAEGRVPGRGSPGRAQAWARAWGADYLCLQDAAGTVVRRSAT